MKHHAICLATLMGLISSLACSQNLKKIGGIKKSERAHYVLDTLLIADPTENRKIIYYFVEEKISAKGGYTTTYKVSKLSLIPTYNLGPMNTRTITPIYEKGIRTIVKTLILVKNELRPTGLDELVLKNKKGSTKNINSVASNKNIEREILAKSSEFIKAIKSEKVINVYPLETYERVVEKGYKSIELFQKLGDSYFFKGDYIKAIKWYGKLFEMSTDLKTEFKERYAYSLRAAGIK